MRALSEPVKTYNQGLTTGLQIQPSQVLPNFGPLLGLYVDLSVTIAGGTASKTSQSIDNVLNTFAIDDQFGKSILNVHGTDLTVLNDILQPRGVRTAPPAITTDGAGNGSADWQVFLPITVASGDMPAVLKVTLDSKAALQNADLASAGTVTVVCTIRAAYAVESDGPTLRISASNPPHQQGDNAAGPFLPAGFQVEALAFTVTDDAHLGYVSLFTGGASFASQQPAGDFVEQDTMLMQSGHLSGEFIGRYPVWEVDSTTVLTINLATDSAIRLYSIATVPQKRS